MEEEKLTWADVMRGFEESRKLIDEWRISTKEANSELRAMFAESRAEYEKKRQADFAETQVMFEKSRAEYEKSRAESEKSRAEYEKNRAEYEKNQAEYEKKRQADLAETKALFEKNQIEYEKRQAKLDAQMAETNKKINGISDSNGMFAEEFFFNTLSEKKEFAGIHFDEVEDDIGYRRKLPDGKRIKDQFDILMTNAASVAVLEVKYRARKDDVETLAGRKLKNFKILFPEYNGLKVYLGLAALAFEDDAVEEARKYGIGLLQQVGETVEYAADWEVKAY
jgi:phage-related minor tail protein